MKKHLYFAVRSKTNQCNLIESIADFNTLQRNVKDIEESDFVFKDATDWGGYSNFEQISLFYENIILTGRKIKLTKALEHKGCDTDCGSLYPWTTTFDEIWEAEIKQPNIGWYEPLKR